MSDIDENELGPGRTAIVAADGVRAVHRGPMQVRLTPPLGTVDAGELLDTIAALGVDVAGISPQALERLNDCLPELIERLVADEDAPAVFDRDPGSFRDVLGDELADALVTLRQRVMGMRSAINPPGSDGSTRRPARRTTPRLLTARDPAVEERADALRQDLIEWALARRPNMAALKKSPERMIARRYADEPEAVRRAMLREVRRAAQTDA
jgi:hypothetical protein